MAKAKNAASTSAGQKRGPPIANSRSSKCAARRCTVTASSRATIIAKGTRIIEYLGDRISHEEADKRYEDHDENDNHTFLFIVDKRTVIDAGVGGNDARFINHQCDGNCESVIEKGRVFIDAARDIEAGEELGYDYQIGREKDDPANVDEIYACRCGSPQVPRHHAVAAEERNRETPHAEAAAAQARKSRRAAHRRSVAENGRAGAPDRPARRARLRRRRRFRGSGLLADLRARCLELNAAGALRPARIGRGANERLAPEVRGDFIAWLSEPELDAEQQLLGRLEELRVALNRGLMTGLEDFQGHFALYPSGAAYARHFDRLVGTDVRAISAALYLNDDWVPKTAEQLRIYTGGGASEDVLPVGGRLVAFQSDRFEHEVLPAKRERLSFTGWYRRRPLEGFV